MKAIRVTSGTLAVFAAGFFLMPGCAREPGPAHPVTPIASNNPPGHYQFAVTGMFCEGCAGGLRSELLRTPGVKTAEVNFRSGTASVTGDPQQLTSTNLIRVIGEAGFAATPARP